MNATARGRRSPARRDCAERAGSGYALAMRERWHFFAAAAVICMAGAAFAVTRPWPMSSPHDLAPGKFLVANRHVGGPHFQESVVLLVEYGTTGAVGLVVNKPTGIALSELLPDVEPLKGRSDEAFLGGPVSQQVMVLLFRSDDPPADSHPVTGDVHFSGSLETLRRVVEASTSQSPFRVYVGYSGWAPMQLEAEVSRGDWLIVPAEAKAIFEMDPAKVWPELLESGARLEAGAPPALRAIAFPFPLASRRGPTDPGRGRPPPALHPARLRTPAPPTRATRHGA